MALAYVSIEILLAEGSQKWWLVGGLELALGFDQHISDMARFLLDIYIYILLFYIRTLYYYNYN